MCHKANLCVRIFQHVRKIRRYEKRDFSDYVATLEKTTNWGKEAGEELESRMSKLTQGDQVWVAELDAKAYGFMILTSNNDDSLEVDWLDVNPSVQRKGLGTLLLEKAEEIANAERIQALSVHTQVSNKQMIAFSLKNGFKASERIKDFYGKRKDALRFKKTVTDQ
jgi:ribosomal protein S18 acetylase RimI-like enzyme